MRSTARRSNGHARQRPRSARPSASARESTGACWNATSAPGRVKALKDLAKLPEWRTVQRYPSGFRFPEGESFVEMQSRITTTLGRLVAKHPGQTIVAVSHADPIKAAVADALGTHLDLFQRIVIAPCSVTAIWFASEGPAVLTTNSTGDDLTALALS